MIVRIVNQQKAMVIASKQVKALANEVVALEKRNCDELAIHFLNKKKSGVLHQQYFQDPSPTDCLSFPIDIEKTNKSEYCLLGDVFVCPEVAIEYAAAHGKNPYEELSLYIVHGILHLIGYDDLDPKDRACMRIAERKHMKNLKKKQLVMSHD